MKFILLQAKGFYDFKSGLVLYDLIISNHLPTLFSSLTSLSRDPSFTAPTTHIFQKINFWNTLYQLSQSLQLIPSTRRNGALNRRGRGGSHNVSLTFEQGQDIGVAEAESARVRQAVRDTVTAEVRWALGYIGSVGCEQADIWQWSSDYYRAVYDVVAFINAHAIVRALDHVASAGRPDVVDGVEERVSGERWVAAR